MSTIQVNTIVDIPGTGAPDFPNGMTATGTAALPAYSASGDTNSGMFFPSADTIGVSTGGIEHMRIDSAGNVGIGTSSPEVRLQIEGSFRVQSNSPYIQLSETDTTDQNFALRLNNGEMIFEQRNNDFSIQTERMRIDSAGNVGIGTTNPSTALQVNGTVTATTFTASSTITGSISGTSTGISNTGTVPLATATEQNDITITAPAYSTDTPVKLLNFNWYNNVFSLGNIRSGSTGSNGFGVFYTASGGSRTQIATFSTSGAFTAANEVTAYSDARIKDNVTVIADPLTKVLSIRGVNYTRTDLEDKGRVYMGVVAQEIEQYIPEVVTTMEDGTKTVNYGAMAGLFIEAIKSQQANINKLEALVQKLLDK